MATKTRDDLTDCGGGFYIDRERVGAATWYYAMQLTAPGGNVMNRRLVKLSYVRDAKARIEAWKAEDAAKPPR